MADEKTIGSYKVVNFPTTATLIAVGVITLAVLVVVLLFFVEIPKENVSPLNLVAGVVLGWGGTVVAFYFGDSKKSSQQQDTINALATNPAPGGGGGGGVTVTATATTGRPGEAAIWMLDVPGLRWVPSAEADKLIGDGKARLATAQEIAATPK